MSRSEYSLSMNNNRTEYIDALKAIAIIMVVMGHVLFFSFNIPTYESILGCLIYSANMPIFFFLSGLFAWRSTLRQKNIGILLYRKIRTLIVPALIFTALAMLFLGDTVHGLIENGFGRYWFTITLFQCFLIYYLIAFAVRCWPWVMNCMLVMLAAFGIIILTFRWDTSVSGFWDINHLAKYFQFFVLGELAGRYSNIYQRIIERKNICWFFLFAYILVFALLQSNLLHGIGFSLCRDIVVRYLGLFAFVSIFYTYRTHFTETNKWNTTLLYIGRNSLPIYMLNYFFFPDLSRWQTFFMNNHHFVYSLIFTLCASLIIIALILLIHTIFARIELIRKVVYGK